MRRATAVLATAAALVSLAALLTFAPTACDPTVVIGARVCPTTDVGDGAVPDPDASLPLTWSDGFEDGFCDYDPPLGFCYADPLDAAAYSLVTSPVHSGRYAAAFTVNSGVDGGAQVRCVKQGVFPTSAYYGAWYYIPATASSGANWTLFFYQGAVRGQSLNGLWDVSLVNMTDGGLRIAAHYSNVLTAPDASAAPAVPIGQWFHLEVYFKRAKDTTGELSVWQDGVLVVDFAGIVTDTTDWGQWYVGNLGKRLAPQSSTLYVDDVTMSPSL